MWGTMGGGVGGVGGFGRAGGFGGTQEPRGIFQEQYHCYSVAYADKAHLEKGDKILLPPSAFDSLARLQVDYPMLFRLESSDKGTMTHSGVLEFTAEEGSCYIPFWMMQNLLIEEGALLTITNVSLPKATFVKLQPQHVDFLEISNPRAVLEHALRNFSCVTKGDVICVPYNSRNYHFELREVKPADAACIIETDCNVDFDAPVGYKEDTMMGSTGSSGSGNAAVATTTGGHMASAPSSGNSTNNNMTPVPPMRKQRADGTSSSGCPSPTLSSMSGASGGHVLGGTKTTGMDIDTPSSHDKDENDNATPKVRIVHGKVIRPDMEDTSANTSNNNSIANSKLLAEQTGSTGVQRNAAIPVQAPQIKYWALEAGDGARLDGKVPSTQLKDKDGNVIDVERVRQMEREKRLAALEAQQAAATAAFQGGRTVSGEPIRTSTAESSTSSLTGGQVPPTQTVSKRKSRIKGKFSKLKSSSKAFEGSAKSMS